MDIDIDFADRTKILELIKHVDAMQLNHGIPQKHISGIYVTEIPYNPLTNLCTLTYEEAEERGYIKLDLLNMGVYQHVESEEEIDALLSIEPAWERLLDEKFCKQLVHLGSHFNIVKTIKPTNIEEVAIVLALIRPGKRHLLNKPMAEIKKEIWVKPTDGNYFFKKSHSIAYSHLVVLHMNLLTVLND